MIVTAPPVLTVFAPTVMAIAPLLPWVEVPEPMLTDPDGPFFVGPELNMRAPVIPAVPAFDVFMVIAPEVVAVPTPAVRATAPPVDAAAAPPRRVTPPPTAPVPPLVAAPPVMITVPPAAFALVCPAVMTKFPPLPVFPLPTVDVIAPPWPPAAVELDIVSAPDEPESAVPVSTSIAPDAAVVDTVDVPINISPEDFDDAPCPVLMVIAPPVCVPPTPD